MEKSNPDSGRHSDADASDAARQPDPASNRSAAPWVRRLFAARGVSIADRQLYWYGVHLEKFLHWCRQQGPPAELEALRCGYLRGVDQLQPPVPDWQRAQIQQALDAFLQGTEHWRWEKNDRGQLVPRFRLKAGVNHDCRTDAVPPEALAGSPGGAIEGPSSEAASRVDLDNWQDRMRRELRLRHYAYRTEQTYLEWVTRFLVWRAPASLAEVGTDDIRRYLEMLALNRRVAASTQNQAFSALLYFFEQVLHQPLGDLRGTLRSQPGQRLFVVLTREEVTRLLAGLEGTFNLMGRLLYGTGMRLMECCRLRVKDVDFGRGQIVIHEGKGNKDRLVMLPQSLAGPLQQHLERVRLLHESDRQAGLPGVYLPNALDVKYPNAGKEWIWYWVFPSKSLSVDPRSKVLRRHHVHENGLQKAFKNAARLAAIPKRIGCHTMRHCFATHLLDGGADIRTVQDLLGHASVETTMVYLHLMQKPGYGVRSPLDG